MDSAKANRARRRHGVRTTRLRGMDMVLVRVLVLRVLLCLLLLVLTPMQIQTLLD